MSVEKGCSVPGVIKYADNVLPELDQSFTSCTISALSELFYNHSSTIPKLCQSVKNTKYHRSFIVLTCYMFSVFDQVMLAKPFLFVKLRTRGYLNQHEPQCWGIMKSSTRKYSRRW